MSRGVAGQAATEAVEVGWDGLFQVLIRKAREEEARWQGMSKYERASVIRKRLKHLVKPRCTSRRRPDIWLWYREEVRWASRSPWQAFKEYWLDHPSMQRAIKLMQETEAARHLAETKRYQ